MCDVYNEISHHSVGSLESSLCAHTKASKSLVFCSGLSLGNLDTQNSEKLAKIIDFSMA